MGIVKSQGTKHSLIQYFGVVISAFSTLFIYPLDTEVYGLLQFLISTSYLLFSFSNLGLHAILLKYFPRFNTSPETGQKFFLALLIGSVLLCLFMISALFVFEGQFIHLLKNIGFKESDVLADHLYPLLVLALLTTAIILMRHQAMNFKRIAVPTVIIDLSLKFFLPVSVLLSVYAGMGHPEIAWYLVIYDVFVCLFMAIYLFRLKAFSINVIGLGRMIKRLWKPELGKFGVFSSLSRMGTILAFRIDAFMITLLLGAASNGIYYIILFIANVIQIPFRSLSLIGIPLISDAWEKGETQKIQSIYQKSALNLSLFSVAIFLFLWFSLGDILAFSPKAEELQAGIHLFLFLGLARVTDSITSLNEPILNYSKHYKFGLLFILGLGVSNAILNFYFIQMFGLVGAAIATCISYALYNFTKMIFLYYTFGFNPWSKGMLVLLGLACLTFLALYTIRWVPWSWLRIILNGVFVFLVFVLPAILTRLSPDFNALIRSGSLKIPLIGRRVHKWMKTYTDQ